MAISQWDVVFLYSKTILLLICMVLQFMWWKGFFWRGTYLFYNGFPSIGKFWSSCFLIFHWLSIKLRRGCSGSLHSLWLFSWWMGVIMIIWEMFHGRISLNLILLLLVVNFVSGFRLEWMYMSLIINTRSSITHPHGFQQFVLLPWLIKIIFLFVPIE